MVEKLKRIMVCCSMPLFFVLIGYALLAILAAPYIRPMISVYSMISQDQVPDFSNQDEAEAIFQEDMEVASEGVVYPATATSSVYETTQYGRISIPSVSIHVKLLYGASDESLYYGAGQRVQSSMPGYGKPVMIGAHTIPYFKNLGNIQTGDIIEIKTYYGLFSYQVTGTKVANAADTSAYDLNQANEQLILFTCYPLDGVGIKEDRLLVYADKVSGPNVGDDNE